MTWEKLAQRFEKMLNDLPTLREAEPVSATIGRPGSRVGEGNAVCGVGEQLGIAGSREKKCVFTFCNEFLFSTGWISLGSKAVGSVTVDR